MLGEMDEEKQKEIAHFVGTKVLESYRNGQENGQATAKLGRLSTGLKQAGKRLSEKQ